MAFRIRHRLQVVSQGLALCSALVRSSPKESTYSPPPPPRVPPQLLLRHFKIPGCHLHKPVWKAREPWALTRVCLETPLTQLQPPLDFLLLGVACPLVGGSTSRGCAVPLLQRQSGDLRTTVGDCRLRAEPREETRTRRKG